MEQGTMCVYVTVYFYFSLFFYMVFVLMFIDSCVMHFVSIVWINHQITEFIYYFYFDTAFDFFNTIQAKTLCLYQTIRWQGRSQGGTRGPCPPLPREN